MDLLKERIMKEGRCFPGGILKVDSFVNHQMDPILMMDLAKEFVRLFSDVKYNKIVTIEASGIAPCHHGGLSYSSASSLRQEETTQDHGGNDNFCRAFFHQGS